MVDPVGTKPISLSDRTLAPVAAVGRTAVAAATGTVAQEVGQAASSGVSQAAADAAASAPVDQERVELIRNAVRNGTFPIYPGKIADRLIALKFQWAPHADK